MNPIMTRREFLKKSIAVGGLTLAVSVTPLGTRLYAVTAGQKLPLFAPGAWLQITPGDEVMVFINKSEMGQGVYTSLSMIIADEADADWKRITLSVAPAADRFKDPVWNMQATGGSTSIRHMYDPLRQAAAAAREMLVKAAAATWGVAEERCETSLSVVKNKQDGRALTYGALAEKAALLEVPKHPTLKGKERFTLIGTPVERMDILPKINGTAVFGLDVQTKGMLYGTVDRPPAYGSEPLAFDAASARKVPGVRKVARIGTGVAVCADTPEAAWKGRASLKTQWGPGVEPALNNESLEKGLIAHLDREGLIARNEGNAQEAVNRSARKVEAVYLLPYLSHMNMEPMNCTASVRKDGCDIWVPTQNQTGVQGIAMKLTGLPASRIRVHTTYLGTGFGRRFETDFVQEALEASKAAGKPVKVIWTREDDLGHDFFRPGNASRIQGGLDGRGGLTAWSHKIAVPSIFARAMPGRIEKGIDPAAVDGMMDTPYELPNFRLEYVKVDTPVPVGFWRSVGNSHNGFTIESFMDELAVAAGRDPLDFRLDLLKNHPRSRRVLEMVAEKSGWGKPPRTGEALGIAHHFSFDTFVAQSAEVSVDRSNGRIKVHRVVCAVDCGKAINPDILRGQMEGGIIMGLSAGLLERVTFAAGGVKSSNYHDYPVLRMMDTPEIEVHIVAEDDALGGAGEPGVPPIAPAVANAVFRAAKIRLRNLPMSPAAVSAALKAA